MSPEKMVRVAEGIYRRGQSYLVPIWNPSKGAKGAKEWHGPRCGHECRHDQIVDLPSARRAKRQLEEAKRKTRGRTAETVRGWSERWLDVFPRVKESTNIHNAERVRAFVRDFGDTPLAALPQMREALRLWVIGSDTGVDGALAKVARTWASSKVLPDGRVAVKANIGSAKEVRAMLNDACKVDLLEANPIGDLRIARGRGRSDIQVLTITELDELCEIALRKHGGYGPWLAAMIRFAAWTGLRPGELYRVALNFGPGWNDDKVNHLDRQARVIDVQWAWNAKAGRVERPKYESMRQVVLLPEAERAISGLAWEPVGPMFRTQRGKPFTGRMHHYYWDPVRAAFAESRPAHHWLRQRLAARGKAGDLDFYELRHFFGTRLAQPPAGVRAASPYEIAQQMGHADGGALAMARYLHVNPEQARDDLLAAWGRNGTEG